ncbi:MAG: hypothetical protein AAF531_06075 [Actinomycetota bacterium]
MTGCHGGGADLYRLTTRIAEGEDRPSVDGAADRGAYPTASLDEALAPIGVEVVDPHIEIVAEPCPGEDAARHATNVAMIQLTMPIDLPAIDHLLRQSGHQVLDLQPATV